MQINKHGSFYIRNGWPTKIIDAISNEQLIFSPNNELAAVDTIGVGRVMVKAMRYWSVVLGISNEIKTQQGVSHNLTNLGEQILRFDPYCQDIGTLWLLHRNLTRDIENATAWYWAFNEQVAKTFLKESFSSDFYAFLLKNGEKHSKSAVEKEFDCFKNTYVNDKAFDIDKIVDEDTVPFFAPLKLVQYSGDGKYDIKHSVVKDIPSEIAYYCILSDNEEHLQNNHQISIDTLLEGVGQIGRYMCLSYSTLLELLQQLENAGKLTLVNNFGNRYIQLNTIDADTVLAHYYHGITR